LLLLLKLCSSSSLLNFIGIQPYFWIYQKEKECNHFLNSEHVAYVSTASCSSDFSSMPFPYRPCSWTSPPQWAMSNVFGRTASLHCFLKFRIVNCAPKSTCKVFASDSQFIFAGRRYSTCTETPFVAAEVGDTHSMETAAFAIF
jgi:hypothetical protein